MISLTQNKFDKMIVERGFEVYSQKQFNDFIESNREILVKGEQGDFSDELEKGEYENLKEEIRSFSPIEVVTQSEESRFRIEKSIVLVREKQVEFDEPELIKGEDGEMIEKARGGVYTNTSLNRKLGRVGQKYGGKKESTPEGDGGKKSEYIVSYTNPDGSKGETTIKHGNITKEEAIEIAKKNIKGSDFRVGEQKPEKFNESEKKLFSGVRRWVGDEYSNEHISSVLDEIKQADMESELKINANSPEEFNSFLSETVSDIFDSLKPGSWHKDLDNQGVKEIIWGLVHQKSS